MVFRGSYFIFKKLQLFLRCCTQITLCEFHKGNLFNLLSSIFNIVQSPKTFLYSCRGISQMRRDLRKTHAKIHDNWVIRTLSWELGHFHSGSFKDSWNLYYRCPSILGGGQVWHRCHPAWLWAMQIWAVQTFQTYFRGSEIIRLALQESGKMAHFDFW